MVCNIHWSLRWEYHTSCRLHTVMHNLKVPRVIWFPGVEVGAGFYCPHRNWRGTVDNLLQPLHCEFCMSCRLFMVMHDLWRSIPWTVHCIDCWLNLWFGVDFGTGFCCPTAIEDVWFAAFSNLCIVRLHISCTLHTVMHNLHNRWRIMCVIKSWFERWLLSLSQNLKRYCLQRIQTPT